MLAPGSLSTMFLRHRFIKARSHSAPTVSSIRPPSISTARAGCLGGVILGSEKSILDHYHQVLRQTGPSLSPFNAWILLKALETLPVRVQRQTDTAGAVATALAGHKKITRLIYPGRPDHPQADIIRKQMRAGSTLCSFEVKGGKEGAFRFLNALQLIGITNNLGDAKSLSPIRRRPRISDSRRSSAPNSALAMD